MRRPCFTNLGRAHTGDYFLGLPVLMTGTDAKVAFKAASSMAASNFRPALNNSLFLAGWPTTSRRFFKVAICAYSSFGMVKLSRSILTLLALGLSFSAAEVVLFTTLIAGLLTAGLLETGLAMVVLATAGAFAATFTTGFLAGAGLAATGFAVALFVATGLAGLLGVVEVLTGLLGVNGLADRSAVATAWGGYCLVLLRRTAAVGDPRRLRHSPRLRRLHRFDPSQLRTAEERSRHRLTIRGQGAGSVTGS